MALIKSISGIRGTIGGKPGDNLTPNDIVECTAAYAEWLKEQTQGPVKIVIGRDGRISGPMVGQLVIQTLLAQGIDVVDLGLSTTPTVEMAVPMEGAAGGIVITASHNPEHWNALKFLNQKGEFISQEDGVNLLSKIQNAAFTYADVEQLGHYHYAGGYIEKHIEAILAMPLVKVADVQQRAFKAVVDCVNSTGAISVPVLLEKLHCEVIIINGEINGRFAHNPEPLPEHLTELSQAIILHKADLGIAVDPDVDRLALVCEDGKVFGEEYTLVAVADYILKHKKGNTVSNLSSTRALRDITTRRGGNYFAAAVGEVNVVEKMKEVNAVIGGEGNGGVIVPELHYGRDALAGIALILSSLAESGKSLSALKLDFPVYTIIKDKIQLWAGLHVEKLLADLHAVFQHENCDTADGLKIDFEQGWVHVRKSNTEPIIRIYAEAPDEGLAHGLAARVKEQVTQILKI